MLWFLTTAAGMDRGVSRGRPERQQNLPPHGILKLLQFRVEVFGENVDRGRSVGVQSLERVQVDRPLAQTLVPANTVRVVDADSQKGLAAAFHEGELLVESHVPPPRWV